MYDPIQVLYNVVNISIGKTLFSLYNTPVTLEIFLATTFVWSVHVKLSSSSIQKKLNGCTLSIWTRSIEILISLIFLCSLPTIIKLFFLIFRDNSFIFSQIFILSSWLLISVSTRLGSKSSKLNYIVVSSACIKKFNLSFEKIRSLRNILNTRPKDWALGNSYSYTCCSSRWDLSIDGSYKRNLSFVCDYALIGYIHCKKLLFISQYVIVIFKAHYCKAGFPHLL